MPRRELDDLKRWLDTLAWLDGRVVPLADGPAWTWPRRPPQGGDPRALSEADTLPSRDALRRLVDMDREPLAITAARLGRIQRNLKRLREPPALAALTENHRRLRRYGPVNARVLDMRQAQLDELAAHWQQTGSVDELVAGLLRPEEGERVRSLVRWWSHARHRTLHRRRSRLETLIEAVAHGQHPLVEAAHLPGRARRRRVERAVREALSLPPDDHPPRPHIEQGGLEAQVRELGESLLRGEHLRHDGPNATQRSQLVKEVALRFTLDAEGAKRLKRERWIDLVARRRGDLAAFEGLALTALQVLEVLSLPKVRGVPLTMLARWVSEGAPANAFVAVGSRTDLHELADITAGARIAYLEWMNSLVPHYRAHGIEVDISPRTFGDLVHAYGERARPDAALMARCLIAHHGRGERSVAHMRSLLDSTLALFRGLPRSVQSLLAQLDAVETGLGRATDAPFAAWLGDDATLDRHLTLVRRLDGAPRLSKRARQDFVRGQGKRPAHKTQRWLARRNEALRASLYDRLLEALLARLVEERFGAPALAVDAGWRDALRLHLLGGRNQDLLASLVRHVAQGKSLASLPANAAWVDAQRQRFSVGAWLTPIDREVTIAGERYRLHTEERPLEVLPMGIPFDTCLSLLGGFNAPSAIMNAIDINKRVIYLRNKSGSVVARKLIGVTDDATLVGFRVYCSLPAERRSTAAAVVDTLALAIAEDAGLKPVVRGDVPTLHDGFWYDDGPEPFAHGADSEGVTDYLSWLGLPTPDTVPEALHVEASAWAAVRDGRLPSIHSGGPLAQHLWATLTECQRDEAARHDYTLRQLHLVSRYHRDGLGAALRWAIDHDHDGWQLTELVHGATSSATLAREIVAAAEAQARGRQPLHDHSFAHDTFYFVDHLAALPERELFTSLDRLGPVWDRVVDDNPGCADCRREGLRRLREAVERAHRRDQDALRVVEVLRARRRHALTQDAALHIASRFLLADGEANGPQTVSSVRRALRQRLRRHPDDANDPRMLAAWLRHGAPNEEPPELLRSPQGDPLSALADLTEAFPALVESLVPRFDEPPTSYWAHRVHHQHLTPLRARLRERLARRDGDAAADLARLGDIEVLAGRRNNTPHVVGKAVVAHLERPTLASALVLASNAHHRLGTLVHPAVVDEAWHRLENGDEEAAIIVAATAGTQDLRRRLAARWAEETPGSGWCALTRIAQRASQRCVLPPQQALRALRGPLPELFDELSTPYDSDWVTAWREVASPGDVAPVLARWLDVTRSQNTQAIWSADALTVREVATALLKRVDVSYWVAQFVELPDALATRCFLDAIAGAHVDVEAVEVALGEHTDSTVNAASIAWLRCVLAGHALGPAPAA